MPFTTIVRARFGKATLVTILRNKNVSIPADLESLVAPYVVETFEDYSVKRHTLKTFETTALKTRLVVPENIFNDFYSKLCQVQIQNGDG